MVYKYNQNISLEKQCILEIQIRTQLQHSWATTVEVLGTYLNQPLKQSVGEKKYLDVFKKISKLFVALENGDINYELIKKIKEVEDDMKAVKILEKLESFNIVADYLNKNSKGQYVLLKMDFKQRTIEITKYDEFKQANEDYSNMERNYFEKKEVEVVLLLMQDINNLQKSYPNYFMDTTKFIENFNILFELVVKNENTQEMIDSIENENLREKTEIMFENITKNISKIFDRRNK